ncbi:unnamed protein product [Effrenium voratum]|uniref:Zeta toxin domain-containing protein n=1 Tax=Effrenium voratum TaxID=2562239 RepID=A0AA36N505_9DINO|nr:unnamed protein product [Effrenium voratum]
METKIRQAAQEWEVPASFDWSSETFDNYGVHEKRMHGPYKYIRDRLDFEHHGCYDLERQKFQDTIIAHIVGSGPREPHPWIIFTAGSFFAGKSWVASWLLEQGHLPLQVVRTDPDLIRTQLPEWTGYLKRDSSQAAVMTQREAGTCGLIAQWEAMRQGRHILVDGSLRNAARQRAFFAEIRAAHPEYRIAIIHVFADWDVMERRSSTKREGGRVTSPKALRTSFDAVTNSVRELETGSDLTVHISNNDSDSSPRLTGMSRAGDKMTLCTWDEFRSAFQQPPGPVCSVLKAVVLVMVVTGVACCLPLGTLAAKVQQLKWFPFF